MSLLRNGPGGEAAKECLGEALYSKLMAAGQTQ